MARSINTSGVIPVKMDLYVHIRLASQSRKRRKSRNTEEEKKKKKGKDRKRKTNKKRRRKPGKKRKGRRIKLTVTNGRKRLAKLRRRVTDTYWFAIELPISQFPKEISHTDVFMLCITCKRCKKKVSLDLYRNQSLNNLTEQEIPFINIIAASHLPHSRVRSKRASEPARRPLEPLTATHDTVSIADRRQCCFEKIFTEELDIPYLLRPSQFNMSTCETLPEPGSVAPASNTFSKLLSRDTPGSIHRQCVPASHESFTYSFLDKDLTIKYASIPNLLPSGCKCVQSWN